MTSPLPGVVLAPFRYRDNQTRLTCYIKVSEIRVGPRWWPRTKQRRKGPSSGFVSKGASTSLFGLPHSILLTENHRQFFLWRPIKIDLPNI